jgi:HEAT repeat protein
MLWWTLQRLRSSNPDVRMKAIRSLGSAQNRRAVPGLIKTLEDENSRVRLSAIEALGVIGHPASAEPLVSVLSRHPKNEKSRSAAECEAIARALAGIGVPAVHPLMGALESEERDARRWAATALGSIKDSQAVEPLIRKLEDNRSEVRKAAALALGEIGDTRAVTSLMKAASNRDLETRRAAVEALGLLKSEEGIDAVVKALEDSSESVQLAAVSSLARIGGLAAAESLRSAMSGTRKAVCEVAESALKNMSFEPSSAEERAEFALLRDDFETVSRAGQAAVPALIRALGFKDSQMREKAAQMLASLRAPESIQPLLNALKDHHAPVQESAARALINFGVDARVGLEKLLAYYDTSVVRLAASALGEIGSPESVQPLAEILSANASISGEYPDLFDAVCCAAEAIAKILSRRDEEVSRENLERIAALPEAIRLRGQSPRSLDCLELRNKAAFLSQTRMD